MSNQALINRSLKSVWHPCTQMKHHHTQPLMPIKSANGVWLSDFDGKEYLDGVSSWWVNIFGHNNTYIKNAIKQQLDTLEHTMLAGFTHEPVITLSERLADLTGLGHAFYGSDGASATEIALKMSFHFWQNTEKPKKTQFISLQNSYHGETLGALGATDVAIFTDTYAPLLTQSAKMMSPDARLAEAGESAEDYALRCADALEQYVAANHWRLAAFIIEPMIQCASGMGMYSPVYLHRAREICDEYDVHLIADEIAVGFGRTGTMFACENAGIKPDFICLSKGITGGYLPLSAVLTTDAVYDAFYHDQTARGFLHSHSYTGNALACSAALATLELFDRDDVLVENEKKSAYLAAQMQVLKQLPIKNLRQQGMVAAFEVEAEDNAFSALLNEQALKEGLLLRPIDRTVYFMPPYIIDEPEIDFMVQTTKQAIERCL